MGVGGWGLGFGVRGSGFGVYCSGFGGLGLGFGADSSRDVVQVLSTANLTSGRVQVHLVCRVQRYGAVVWECHMVVCDPFIISQLAPRNQLEGLVWCKSGHASPEILGKRNVGTPPYF